MELQRILVSCFIFSLSMTNIFALPKEQELDRISALPGQPPVNFSQFSGYITVNNKPGRALFYWLTEATTDPHEKPLVLWLNGGPGCSSVGYGASEEIGPFRINKTGSSLYLNKYAWNKVANILFLESPAGVGFSYSNASDEVGAFGDKKTARDSLAFLVRWLHRFPQYKHRDFYIAGESYGGHYVPQLAQAIYDHNMKSPHKIINLKGFIVGNGIMHNYYDNIGTVKYWWTHSMISDQTYKRILKTCNFRTNLSLDCVDALNYARYNEFGNIDQYSIYTPPCNASSQTRPMLSQRLKNTLINPGFYGYDPCTQNYAEVYYNRPDVQKALHANTTGIPYPWTACSGILFFFWRDSAFSVLPIYKKLIAAGLRIWVYSGDTDAMVPATATRFSISHLHLKIKTPWYAWYAGGQVGGWTEVYDGLTYATVRGAGHEVPLFQPRRAFELFEAFLSGKELPKS